MKNTIFFIGLAVILFNLIATAQSEFPLVLMTLGLVGAAISKKPAEVSLEMVPIFI